MRAFTGHEDAKAKFEELHRALDRVGELLLAARKEHELAVAFIGALLGDNPSAEDLKAALLAYKEKRTHELTFMDSKR